MNDMVKPTLYKFTGLDVSSSLFARVQVWVIGASQQKIVRLLAASEPCNLGAIISAVIVGYIVHDRV